MPGKGQVHGGLRDGPIGDDPQLVEEGDGAVGLALSDARKTVAHQVFKGKIWEVNKNMQKQWFLDGIRINVINVLS